MILVNTLFSILLMSTFHLTLSIHPSAWILVCLSTDGRGLASLMMTEVACTMPLYRLLPCMLCTVNLPRTMSRGYVALMPTDTQALALLSSGMKLRLCMNVATPLLSLAVRQSNSRHPQRRPLGILHQEDRLGWSISSKQREKIGCRGGR